MKSNKHFLGTIIFFGLISLAPGFTSSASAALTIPTAHPRLWWNAARLTQAKAWYAANPFTPDSDDPQGNAFRYVLTGENAYAQKAIDSLMSFTIDQSELDGTASDNYRWADWVPVVFDWCYNAMTDAQRATFMTRYNGYVGTMMQKSWGAPGGGFELNNYFWGYMRNEINWAVATYYEQPATAATFSNDALVNRWQNDFVPFSSDVNRGYGGVLGEGDQYGLYTVQYRTIPFKSLALLGRDLDLETDFFKQTVYYLIYDTTNGPSHMKGDAGAPFYQYFPFNDDEQSYGYPAADDNDSADFMTMMAEDHSGSALGQFARHWVNQVQPNTSLMEQSVAQTPGPELSFTQLPLDYYASGEGFFFGRSGWTQNDAQVMFQLKELNGVGHAHMDAATFQIWRRGYWVSKESTGYDDTFADTTSEDLKAHNGLLVGGLGYTDGDTNGIPRVTRLESNPNYLYVTVDLSQYYRNNLVPYSDVAEDNPYVGSAIREFLFIKPLQTLVILDRVKSIVDTTRGGTGTPEQVQKTELIHTPYAPIISGNSAVAQNGDQALKVTSLFPSGAVLNYVDEGAGTSLPDSQKQFRLQVTASGTAETLLLTVLQVRGATDPDLALDLQQTAGRMTLTMTHPTLGSSQVVFSTGMASAGGQFAYATSGNPLVLSPLYAAVQQCLMTDAGPVWGTLGGGTGGTVPTAPSNLGATITVSSTVALSWTRNSTNETGFRIERQTGGSGSFAYLTTAAAGATSYTDNAVSGGTTYVYHVMAQNAAGTSSPAVSNPVTTPGAPLDTTPPTRPTGLSAPAVSSTTVTLSWTASTDNAAVAKYWVYRNNVIVATVTATGFTDTNASPSTAYTYNVMAIDTSGNPSAESANLAVTTASPNGTGGGATSSSATLLDTEVFPNPSVGKDPTIRAFAGDADELDITIYDAAGSVVHTDRVTGGPTGTASDGRPYYDYVWTGKRASGVYYAVIHGKKGGAVVRGRVKFAVVK